MATVNDLAVKALRELYLLEGGAIPDASSGAVAVDAVLAILAQLPEIGGGRDMDDRSVERSCTAREDERILCQAVSLTVTTPCDPREWARLAVVPVAGGTVTVSPYKRLLEGALASIPITTATTWYYRSSDANWVKVTSLTEASDSPYPDWCDLFIVHLAAEEMAATFGVDIDPALAVKIESSKGKLRARFGRPRDRDWGGMVPSSVRGPGRLWRHR